ncbi:hypothetical protein BO99DRAFT_426106 [Aspergillus violaceofuscus CBS 115571]|uniref:Uncharacterized protein n=1 Tax=Aspergillus violaceofuscus (strain CBS 115571) TaxID=1450538 RepID=A0A2V5GTS2_ASPV1|nr:hypothetical protein BO99DRAFT_426106 [Aspergillus violaceofuscus CBS 115571]
MFMHGLSIKAYINAFALNIAAVQSVNTNLVANTFLAAKNIGFFLFFSFNYAGNGPWAKDDINIKKKTGCFFALDWFSLGAIEVIVQADDIFYINYFKDKPYIMPVFLWFFTNIPEYNKNWLWRGDDIWFNCVTGWYRFNKTGACTSNSGTTGNTAGQLQINSNINIYYSSILFTRYLDTVTITVGCRASTGVKNWNIWIGSTISANTISIILSYLITSKNISYSRLYFFNCNYSYYPSTACGTVEVAFTISIVLDFIPPAYTTGKGSSNFVNLYSFGCAYSFCPIYTCNCTATGVLDLFAVLGDAWSAENQLFYINNNLKSWCEVQLLYNYNLTIFIIADLNLQSAEIADEYILYYILNILNNIINIVVANYTNILVYNNYNKTLKYYKRYVENNITSSLASAIE